MSDKIDNSEVLKDNLLDIKEVFDEYKINFFLSHGTLLAYHRNRKFMKWDDDVDLGSFEDFNNVKRREFIIGVLENAGFNVQVVNEDDDENRHIIVMSGRDGHRRLPYGIKFWRYNGDCMRETNFDYPYEFFKLRTIKFFGKEFKIPDRNIDYLMEVWYGEGWKKMGRKMWIYKNTEDIVIYENQKMGFKHMYELEEAFLECDEDGELIMPLNRVGRSIRSM